MSGFKYRYECPHCGTRLELQKRVTITKRRCPHCGLLVTPEEIDFQEDERRKHLAERYLMDEVRALDDEAAKIRYATDQAAKRRRVDVIILVCALIGLPVLAVGGIALLIVLVAVVPKPDSSGAPSASASPGRENKEDPKAVPKTDKSAEPKRKDEENQEQRDKSDPKSNEEARKAKEQAEAKAKAEAERLEVDMVLYELAKAKYHAATRVRVAQQFAEDARSEALAGHVKESERFAKTSRDRLQEVIDLYPDTDAAVDAKQLLDGKTITPHPVPSKPVLPKGAKAQEDEIAVTMKPLPPPDVPADSPAISVPASVSKPVYLRGYTRPDGVFVQPHYRMVSGKDKPG